MNDSADPVGVVPIWDASSWMSKPSLRTRRSIMITTCTAAPNVKISK
jgi:hypothetical protein